MVDVRDVALAQIAAQQRGACKPRDYYAGRHELAFASEKFENAFGDQLRAFAYNLCAGVVEALADRLRITGWGTTPAAAKAEAIWKHNLMAIRHGEVQNEALIAGDGYVIVWPDPTGDHAQIVPNDADHVTVYYSQEQPGVIEWAAKVWAQVDRSVRLNVYYADRIEKYVTAPRAIGATLPTARAFQPYQPPGEEWPLRHAYGRVPVFHFPNNAPIGAFGVSELRDIIPLQNALNKSVADMLVAMEFAAYPQRYAIGISVRRDPKTSKVIKPFDPGMDRIWAVEDDKVNFGQFLPADLGQFLAVIGWGETAIARASRTPLHWIVPQGGTPASGEALKTQQEPHTAKALDRQGIFGATWADVMRFALLVEGTPLAADEELAPVWKDPTPASDKEGAETAQIWGGLGVTLRTLLKKYWPDLTDDQITDMLNEEATRQAASNAAALEQIRNMQAAASGGNPAATLAQSDVPGVGNGA